MWLSMTQIVYTLLFAHTKATNPTSAKTLFVHKKTFNSFFAMFIRLVYYMLQTFLLNTSKNAITYVYT